MFPFIDLKKQFETYRREIEQAVLATLDSGVHVLGPVVAGLEAEMKAFVGVRHAITCANGTDALYLAMLAAGIGKDDEVITTPFTFFASTSTIMQVGATPVYVDIAEDGFNIDHNLIEKRITKKTKAILSVSLFGLTANLTRLRQIADQHGLILIEDAAQSFGAKCDGKTSCSVADLSTTSFYPAKPLGTYGEGGAVFTNNDDLAHKVGLLRHQGQSNTYWHEVIGMNSRLSPLQAAILSVKLKYFSQELQRRNDHARNYSEQFNSLSDLVLPNVPSGYTSSWAQYTIRTKDRQRLQECLKERGVPTAIHYPHPVYDQPALRHLKDSVGDMPNATRAAREVLSLPMCAFLTQENQGKVVDAVKSALR